MRNPPQTLDQVTDPKTYPEVAWPAGIDAAKKSEVQALSASIRDGGLTGTRAKRKLATPEFEYAALYGIVEQLRLLDYRNADESMTGFELNKMLEEILVDINTRYGAVEIGETIPPNKAEWNTQTVNAWIKHISTYPDEGTFKKQRAERRKKAAEKDK